MAKMLHVLTSAQENLCILSICFTDEAHSYSNGIVK
jgi:hypothetical protein